MEPLAGAIFKRNLNLACNLVRAQGHAVLNSEICVCNLASISLQLKFT